MNYTDEYIRATMQAVTNLLQNIVMGCKAIIESGDHKKIALLHATNDFYCNEYERIIYGDTMKNMYAKAKKEIIKKNKK